MAISRMNMERQMRNMGGLMTLEEPRQGYFLGKIVRKAKKAVKKVVKSPLGKLALAGVAANYAPLLFGKQSLLTQAGGFSGLPGLFAKSKLGTGLASGEGFLGTIGNVFRVGGEKANPFSGLRILGGLAGAGAIAAPFLMGGDDEEVVDESLVTDPQESVEAIRQQARNYYQDPTNSALYFMPPKSAVRFGGAFAGGGLADIPREGYKFGELVEKLSMFTPSGIGMALGKKLAKGIKDDEDMKMASAPGPFDEYDDIARELFGKPYKDLNPDEMEMMQEELERLMQKFRGAQGGRVPAQEGGLMDLGGMEKDYREGGFVPIGAKERADDVPARLSKNEFVFTADAVRNAGGGDIDKGAEVMQNMMDNLEAGGNISEESQGKENPAQAMFDQAQMMESRII